MSTLREAAQQALEALEQRYNATLWYQAIHALRDALAQEEQEPVAWMVYTLDGKSVCVTDNPADFSEAHRALPLYTHPPRREWQRGCQVCGIGAHGETMGYVCPRSDCPTRITCGGAI